MRSKTSIIFAPLVLILDAQGYSTEDTVIACAVYFWSRLVHAIVYTMGVPVLAHACIYRRVSGAGCAGVGGVRKALVRRAGAVGDRAQIQTLRGSSPNAEPPRHRAAMRKMRPDTAAGACLISSAAL